MGGLGKEWHVEPLGPSHRMDLAFLHHAALSGGFLPTLGVDFLQVVYEGIVWSPAAVGFVATCGPRVVGFLVGATSTRRLFLDVVRSRWSALTWQAVRQISRRPQILWRVLETLFYPLKPRSEEIEAELVILAVESEFRRAGCAKELIRRLNEAFTSRGIQAYRVVAYSDSREAVAFYESMGFVLKRTLNMYGRVWNLYVYRCSWLDDGPRSMAGIGQTARRSHGGGPASKGTRVSGM